MRFWIAILCLGGLSACADMGDASRYQFGVSAMAGPSAPDLLAWKANQICTLGYRVIKQDALASEGGGQIVDNHLECNPYQPSLDVVAFPLPVIF
jgi:hypothetical protein